MTHPDEGSTGPRPQPRGPQSRSGDDGAVGRPEGGGTGCGPGGAVRSARVTRRAVLAAAVAAPLAACASQSSPPAPSSVRASGPAPSRSAVGADAATPSATAPASSSAAGGPAHEVVRGPDQPAVALTFHGSGDPALAEALLRQVEAAGARVTVLAVGTWLAANPDVGARILAAGHDLGNHTWHHLPMSHMGESEAYREISRGARIVAAAAGSTGWFRPSGTQHASAAVLAAAGRSGYRSSISYDVDPRDYTDPGADLVTRRVLAGVGPGSIVSLHLGHAGTVAAMPALLTGLRARSLRAVTLSALLVGVAR